MSQPTPIAGIILAGGRSRRMGGVDKSLLPLDGRPLIAHAIARLQPQVAAIAINANGDVAPFAAFGLPVVADTLPNFQGPLAGILAGLRWAEAHGFRRLATAAADTPFFPQDLVTRLAEAASDERIAVARSAGRLHPVFGLFLVDRADDLEAFLSDGGSLKVADWLARHDVIPVDFADPAENPVGPFFNINTPADLAIAEGHRARTLQER